jgi:hypothetical protein
MEKASAQVESDRIDRTVAESMLMNFCGCTDREAFHRRIHIYTLASADPQPANYPITPMVQSS